MLDFTWLYCVSVGGTDLECLLREPVHFTKQRHFRDKETKNKKSHHDLMESDSRKDRRERAKLLPRAKKKVEQDSNNNLP